MVEVHLIQDRIVVLPEFGVKYRLRRWWEKEKATRKILDRGKELDKFQAHGRSLKAYEVSEEDGKILKIIGSHDGYGFSKNWLSGGRERAMEWLKEYHPWLAYEDRIEEFRDKNPIVRVRWDGRMYYGRKCFDKNGTRLPKKVCSERVFGKQGTRMHFRLWDEIRELQLANYRGDPRGKTAHALVEWFQGRYPKAASGSLVELKYEELVRIRNTI